ncbi:glycine cleavage system aminomethyltransferase GcvT [Anaeromicrobium sediminis]|uniref:Aminomethyltransferase n=1 Tax=Anaeromicrobium sediminis TaxID=1478221 RepID=A0A267MFZ3_9FIRM|nr:glycine cleavage system aminomethyltransferase GcvT [Anaeromicrobium sediminis]PAB57720.1 glycine cleavage system protein T [Anaeromicrobium sediminis]
MSNLKRTALFNAHGKHGGKIIDFSGWELPVQYEGITPEHEATRNKAGLFDVSHMGEVEVKGKDAFKFVQNLVTNDVSALEDNQVLYTFMCYEDGGVVDDLLVYRFNEEHFFLVINASNVDKDFDWMKKNSDGYDIDVVNISEALSQLAIQGPHAQEILQKLTDTDLTEIKFFYCKRNVNVAGASCLVSRTGYTGEDGFEIYLDHDNAEMVWEKLMEEGKDLGLRPVGLGARDTLRFEATLPLYGNELTKDITPLEAGLGFFVKLDTDDFIGKEALVKQKAEGLKRKIVGFEMLDKGIPRHGYEVWADGKEIGFVTTGYAAPTVKKNIGFAMVPIEYSKLGTPIEIKVRKRILKAQVVSKRFYTKNYKK